MRKLALSLLFQKSNFSDKSVDCFCVETLLSENNKNFQTTHSPAYGNIWQTICEPACFFLAFRGGGNFVQLIPGPKLMRGNAWANKYYAYCWLRECRRSLYRDKSNKAKSKLCDPASRLPLPAAACPRNLGVAFSTTQHFLRSHFSGSQKK